MEVLEFNMEIPGVIAENGTKGAERRLSGAVVCRSGAEWSEAEWSGEPSNFQNSQNQEARSGTEIYHGSTNSEWSGLSSVFR